MCVRSGYAVMPGLSENRKTPQDATDCRKMLQNAHSYETPMYYGMFHTLMYEGKPIGDRKIQHKYGTKFRPQKCISR